MEKIHICRLLKNIRYDFYFYNIFEKTERALKTLQLIDRCLDQILVYNQYITNILTDLLIIELGTEEFYKIYISLFPKYIDDNVDKLVEMSIGGSTHCGFVVSTT